MDTFGQRPLPTGQRPSDRGKDIHCDYCGLAIRRPPSQCRGKTKTCSPACRAAIRKVRVKCQCVICGGKFEQAPNRVGMIVTCSEACRKLRRAYDVVKNAPRVETGQTLAQFCEDKGITRNQARYRANTGRKLDAPLIRGRKPKQ